MKCGVTILLLTALAGCQASDLKPRYSDDTVQWGEAVDGLKVGVAHREYQSGFAPGREQVYLSVQLLNVSGRPLNILTPVLAPGHSVIPEALSGDESVAVRMTYDTPTGAKVGEFKPERKPAMYSIPPGHTWAMELRVGAGKFGLKSFVPGRITVSYVNRQDTIRYKTMGNEPVTGLWTGEARSRPIPIDAPATTAPTTAPSGAGGGAVK